MESSALADAITRSFEQNEPDRPAMSPLRALGRRQLSGFEVLAQSVATTAPAASMVLLPVTLLAHGMPLAGLVTIVAATVFVTLIAWCTAQFTRRMVASGGLYAFVFQGLGARAALTTGVAMAAKYVGSGALTLYHGGQAVIAIAAECGLDIRGPAAALVYLAIAAAILTTLLRGVRFAALAILVVEVCSLVFIVGLMLVPGSSAQLAPVPPASGSALLPVMLSVLFALAGFESATFIGPEARRPMVTVTRTVLATPVICGVLFVFAGWAAWTGHADTLVGAYLHGASTGVSPLIVALVHLGMCCSWLASAMASSNAASRLLYSMGVEGVLPRAFARTHRGLRTPWVALTAAAAAVGAGALAFSMAGSVPGEARVGLRIALLIAYVLVAAGAIAFLHRIHEVTGPLAWTGRLAVAIGLVAIGYVAFGHALDGEFGGLLTVAAVPSVAAVWYRYLRRTRPDSLAAVGVFDSPESADVLPGAGAFAVNSRGSMALVGADHPDAVRQ
ncbi:APC family permease [Rhodococcus spelaei]|uniref:APC family permease n=1 Tax=Rhodococcus spelaei TaxID=2546320 RepID=A0A541B000_9NOCA|nr:APC family permease [Rhodococcus spelaei]TQF65632.1 APC family permease [Rhodococcus spelaei]